jgi:hypothetical protein
MSLVGLPFSVLIGCSAILPTPSTVTVGESPSVISTFATVEGSHVLIVPRIPPHRPPFSP